MKAAEAKQKMGLRKLNVVLGAYICLVTICLSGCSKQNFGLAPQQDVFSQKVVYSTDVDILWVLDTSGSMEVYQQQLANQVDDLFDALDSTRLNYHMGVTNLDCSGSGLRGRFISRTGEPSVLTAGTPGLRSLVKARMTSSLSSSPIERGLQAMKMALTEPNSLDFNKGFLRPSSLLVVIFVSDEDDQSSPEDYAKFLDTLRPPTPAGDRSWIVSFMGVTPQDRTCGQGLPTTPAAGTKYIELANQSGGVVESICSGELSRGVRNLRKRVMEIVSEYPLKRVPRVDSIRVLVNGQTVPKDPENGWQYIRERNVIHFYGKGVPLPDSQIQVDFDPETFK